MKQKYTCVLPDWVKVKSGCEASGTHLQGEISVPYDVMIEVFGKPMARDGGKIDVEWHMTFRAFDQFDYAATIYNYKDGPNYNGKSAKHPKDRLLVEWHIGGLKPNVVGYIANMVLAYYRVALAEAARR